MIEIGLNLWDFLSGEPHGAAGTKVILHLKEDQTEYLRAIASKGDCEEAFQFIGYPSLFGSFMYPVYVGYQSD